MNWRIWWVCLVLCGLGFGWAVVSPAAEPAVPPLVEAVYKFKGTWVEDTNHLQGELAAWVVGQGRDRWRARFTGKFDGELFDYQVDFTGPADKLTGTATINREVYTWTGVLTDEELRGTYTSRGARNYSGSFTCKAWSR